MMMECLLFRFCLFVIFVLCMIECGNARFTKLGLLLPLGRAKDLRKIFRGICEAVGSVKEWRKISVRLMQYGTMGWVMWMMG